jgi:hypothetical protein
MFVRVLCLFLCVGLIGCSGVSSLNTLNKTNKPNVGASLKIDVLHGKMSIAEGEPSTIKPTTIIVPNNTCQQTQISTNSDGTNRTLQTCYLHNSLYFDSKKIGRTQTKGAIRFAANPLWTQGFTYKNVTSFGNAELSDTDIRIQTQ